MMDFITSNSTTIALAGVGILIVIFVIVKYIRLTD